MNPWIGIIRYLVSFIATVAIRAPHANQSGKLAIVTRRKGAIEIALLALMRLGVLVLPLLAIFTSLLSFADYPLHPAVFSLGVMCTCGWLWLFYRSHADLGRNWSATLEIREGHQLVTSGLYRLVRHPMYVAIFLGAIDQALLIPNWIGGPSCLVAFVLMFVLRVNIEEQMMSDKFGDTYVDYMNGTKRLVPYVW